MLLAKTPSTGTWLMTFVNEILNQMPHLAKPQQKFLALLFSTILILRGKVNFLNLSRYCHLSEKTFRRQFRKGFDFLSFHSHKGGYSMTLKHRRKFPPEFKP